MADRLAHALTFASQLSATYEESKPRRRYQRGAKVRRKAIEAKRVHWWAGLGCEICAWRPPDYKMLHAHHIVPLSCGGTDATKNTIVLCPNHHGIAHRVGTRKQGRYVGPETREALILALLDHDKRETH